MQGLHRPGFYTMKKGVIQRVALRQPLAIEVEGLATAQTQGLLRLTPLPSARRGGPYKPTP